MYPSLADIPIPHGVPAKDATSPGYLTATDLARFHVHFCRKLLWLSNDKRRRAKNRKEFTEVSLWDQARFRKGTRWEDQLRVGLELLHGPPHIISAGELIGLITLDTRKHFYVVDVAFASPSFSRQFASKRSIRTVSFGTFKPDFLEIWKHTDEGNFTQIRWRVIDAKASRKVKISHQVQIGYYWLALNEIFQEWVAEHPNRDVQLIGDDTGVVWIPSTNSRHPTSGQFSVSLLRPLLEDFLFRDVPAILGRELKNVPWQYNSLCSGCEFMDRCRKEVVDEEKLSMIPQLSMKDHRFLLHVLGYMRNMNSGHCAIEPEIEELHRLLHPSKPNELAPIERLMESVPGTYGRVQRLLHLNLDAVKQRKIGSCEIEESPVLRSAIRHTVEILGKRCLVFPRREDVAVYLSVGIDPETDKLFGFSIRAVSQSPGTFEFNRQVVADAREPDITRMFVETLANVIRQLIAIKESKEDENLYVQFFVFDSNDQETITEFLVAQACESNADPESIRLCIGALLDHSSVLLTTVQPELLASALLFKPSKALRIAEVKKYLRVFGGPDVDLSGKKEVLYARLVECLSRTHSSFPHGSIGLQRMLPRLVSIHAAVTEMVAIPEPGFYGLDECVRWLVDGQSTSKENVHGDQWLVAIYKAWKAGDVQRTSLLLQSHGEMLHRVSRGLRDRIQDYCTRKETNMECILPNVARDFHVVYIDMCKDKHLRRLLFMAQYEMISTLKSHLLSRLHNTEPILLSYRSKQPDSSYEYIFNVHSGLAYLDTDPDWVAYKWILVREGSDADLMFDDLAYFDTNGERLWINGEERRDIAFANIMDVEVGEQGVQVRIKLRAAGCTLKGGTFRLKRRLVDFNTKKIVKTLIDIDQTAQTSTQRPLFLRMLDDVNIVGAERPSNAEDDLRAEARLQTFYREVYTLSGATEKPLLFMGSQNKAFKTILGRSITLVWGPPGHGKTHTLALAALRLIELSGRRSPGTPFRILMTSYTKAALANFTSKLQRLIDEVKSIPNMEHGDWRQQLNVGLCDDRMPSPATLPLHSIVAGTVWKLWKWMESNPTIGAAFDVLIIDEGSQMPVADAALAISVLCSGTSNVSKRVIIAGDHLQLAPVLKGTYPKETGPGDPQLYGSILECLMRGDDGEAVVLRGRRVSPDVFGPLTTMLRENFRMVKELCTFTNTIYRGGQFEPQRSSLVPARSLPHTLRGLFQSTNALLTVILRPRSHTPLDMLPFELHLQTEAKVVGWLVEALLENFEGRVFVITPHRAQRSAVNEVLRKRQVNGGDRIRVDTVERMQGDEAEIVIACYGFTTHFAQFESELDFVFHRNRLNVALSRARNMCILIASQAILHPPVSVLATHERCEAFAHVKTFVERSAVVQWGVDMVGDDHGAPLRDVTEELADRMENMGLG
ncbi:uncharacterized protein SPPG_00910 [Spizellomyces punctatus DAOM BR117]|uniref:DNA2/NAM7 helicase-like C-terminal domain-containing protein n=1 Tax=Spizellomyces punctatus (strain DAOM BR117) TaxID=645134 RepID=A0A0L0HR60_SPIPD|nr:uncharacterized protein SPPG_00910 [Spizellomyces punctatus DAOM BR117]KND03425.1 hypothetical protein SPPG_00910 [Spizellomyces punctatus DAOM BR117]|eukprot:XP_016611464.1 hypothetical protein SPPG_00910 [Spizellomyces punctatus DAOM BR117]